MTTMERAIEMLQTMPSEHVEKVYRYMVTISKRPQRGERDRDAYRAALDRLCGALAPYDTGQTYEEIRDEYLSERYGLTDRH